ncbi:MAG TPA: GvpL/GvpF family gas vesicle protein [Thermoanaerobaculia bacterium]
MPLWLYAFTAAPLPEPPPRGAAGEALVGWAISSPATAAGAASATADDELFVVAGEMAAPLEPGEGALRAHDRAVRSLADALDPLLPARFGQTVASAAELATLLAPRRAALLAALGEVAGCVQVTLRFAAAAEPPAATAQAAADRAAEPPAERGEPDVERPPEGPGTRYLHARRESARAAAAPPPPEARPLLARLAPLVRAERVAPARPPFAATVYHLVERRRLDDYRATLAAAALDPPPVASGPWPAWAFAPGRVESVE